MNSTSNAQFWCYMPNRNDTRNLLTLNVWRYLVQMPKLSSVALKALLRLHDFKVSARTHYSHFTWVLVVQNLEPEQVQACLNFASLNCFCTYQRRLDIFTLCNFQSQSQILKLLKHIPCQLPTLFTLQTQIGTNRWQTSNWTSPAGLTKTCDEHSNKALAKFEIENSIQ